MSVITLFLACSGSFLAANSYSIKFLISHGRLLGDMQKAPATDRSFCYLSLNLPKDYHWLSA